MKVKLPMQSQAASGKLVGAIHQAWRGLNIIRKFTMPTIRHTASQMNRRAHFGTLSGNWKNVLTVAMRTTWESMTLIIKDLWGENVSATGLNLYQKINGILLDAGKTLLTEAPTSSAMGSPLATLVNTSALNQIVIPKPSAGEISEYSPFVDIFVAGVSVFNSTGANVTSISTSAVAASIHPAVGIYRHVCFIDENSATNQTINFVEAVGTALEPGLRLSVIVTRYTKDGRKSVSVKLEGITVQNV